VAACRRSGLQLAFVTDAPGGMGRILRPAPTALAAKLLNTESGDE